MATFALYDVSRNEILMTSRCCSWRCAHCCCRIAPPLRVAPEVQCNCQNFTDGALPTAAALCSRYINGVWTCTPLLSNGACDGQAVLCKPTMSTGLCAGHGDCTATGACVCDPGYYTHDCSQPCPGGASDPCSGHGTCASGASGSGICTCDPGYFGVDCAGECSTCSGHGACDHTGACACDYTPAEGYWAGADCDRCDAGCVALCRSGGSRWRRQGTRSGSGQRSSFLLSNRAKRPAPSFRPWR